MKTSQLKPNPDNPRNISKEQLERLKQSLQDFSKMMELRPMIYDPDTMHVLGGNQRLAAIKSLGMKEIPDNWAVPAVGLTDAEKKEFILRDNIPMGEWDMAKLLESFPEFDFESLGLELDFNTRTTKATEDNYNPPEEIETDIVLGDIIQIGPHRIICGDSTLPETYVRLGAPKGDMVFTDPPYNINYAGRGRNTSKHIENDNMDASEFQDFLDKAFQALVTALKPDAPWYVCHASSSQNEFETALNRAGLRVKNQIIWVKPVASMGWGDYRWMHELIFYAAPIEQTIKFYGDRKQYTIWKEEWTDAEIAKAVRAAQERMHDGLSTVWTIGRDTNYVHPTQKPILLCAKAIENSSKRGDIVFDAFLGSGSTLVAAHQLERICYGVELDPKYCQAICDRMRLQDPDIEITIQHIE